MCGVDVDLDDGGSAEEEKEEDFWAGDAFQMLPPPVAHSDGSAWGSRRGMCGSVACGAVVILWNLCVISASALLLAVVFSVVLLPAALLLYAGFLCHSRVSPLLLKFQFIVLYHSYIGRRGNPRKKTDHQALVPILCNSDCEGP